MNPEQVAALLVLIADLRVQVNQQAATILELQHRLTTTAPAKADDDPARTMECPVHGGIHYHDANGEIQRLVVG